jgi:hypothetical protein
VLLSDKNASFTADELVAALNDDKASADLLNRLGQPVSSIRLLHRSPTAFELQLIAKNPDLPIAKLFRYVVLTYSTKAAREAAIDVLRKDVAFADVTRDETVRLSAVPLPSEDSVGFLGTSASATRQWGMHKLNFPEAWIKSKGHAWVAAIDNGVQETHPDINPMRPNTQIPAITSNYRRHLSFNGKDLKYFDQPDEKKDTLGIVGHGTHVAGIIAATHNNGGVVGGCPECSLIAMRFPGTAVNMQPPNGSIMDSAPLIVRAVDVGAQVINMSFETPSNTRFDCSMTQFLNHPVCIALTHAAQNGVSMSAAAGNYSNRYELDAGVAHKALYPLPATHPDVLAVSGLQLEASGNLKFWTGMAQVGYQGPIFGSNYGDVINGVPEISFAAPAHRIISSAYASVAPGETWVGSFSNGEGCGDTQNTLPGLVGGTFSSDGDGIGLCTGNSMAAPHISAMVGLVRSVNPLLDGAGVKSVLIQSAECLEGNLTAPCTATTSLNGVANDAMKKLGYGVPKADKAVQFALGGAGALNRTTPLFAHFSSVSNTHFYTSNPQMALAATRGTLLPAPRYKYSPASVSCPASCTPVGSDYGLNVTVNIQKPDGTPKGTENVKSIFEATPLGSSVAQRASVEADSFQDTFIRKFTSGLTITYVPTSVGTNVTLRPRSINTVPVSYVLSGVSIPGYPKLPCGSAFVIDSNGVATNSACTNLDAKAIASILTTEINPTTGASDLVRLYRLSCAPEDNCNPTANGYHVTFRYVTNSTEVTSLTDGSPGNTYKFDGIEGYVYSKNITQPPGTKMLCSRRNAALSDYILFLENTSYAGGAATTTCAATTSDGLPNGSGYSDPAAVVQLGWAYPVQAAIPLCAGAGPCPAISAKKSDFDGDGKADIVWYNPSTGSNTMWIMNGSSYVSGGTLLVDSLTGWRTIGSGDFNGDGKADLLWYNPSTGSTTLWFMNGTNYIGGGALLVDAPSGWRPIVTGDFNGDGKADIVWYNPSTGVTSLWLMNGTNYIGGGALLVDTPTGWRPMGTGDFNGDGKSDIVWYNPTTGVTSLWLMDGANYIGGGVVFTDTPTGFRPAVIGDFNGDGKADIVWHNPTTGSSTMWLMNGTTYIGGGALFVSTPNGKRPISTGDFNADGKLDILTYNPSTGETAMLMMNGATITSTTVILQDVPNGWTPLR